MTHHFEFAPDPHVFAPAAKFNLLETHAHEGRRKAVLQHPHHFLSLVSKMKLSLSLFLGLVGGAAAFVPTSKPSTPTTVLRMSDDVPLLQIKETVPCFPATPMGREEPVFFGENYWNKLTSEYGSEDTGTFIQAAEIKHGRAAMMATVGFAFHKLGLTLDKISPHEYLSVTENVKFADLATMTPLEALGHVPAAGLLQMFGAIAMIEIYELTHVNGQFINLMEGLSPGLRSGGLTGNLGWNPLQIKITDRRRLVEIQNGRAAMFAICAWVAHDAVPGSVPLQLPWE